MEDTSVTESKVVPLVVVMAESEKLPMAEWKQLPRPNQTLFDWAPSWLSRRDRHGRVEDIIAAVPKTLQLGLIMAE